MTEDFWKIMSVVLLSSVKFAIGGIPLAIFYKFSFLKVVVTTTTGGLLGVFAFTFLSEWLIMAGKKIIPRKPDKKIFTWKNKLIVWVKMKMGLAGLAILTPTILSLPLGLFLAVRYYKNRKKIIIYMCASVVACSLLLSTFKFLF